MDDLKLYGKDECELDSFLNTVLMFSTDIGMEFGMKRRGVLILKRGNVKKSVGITSPAREDKGDREGIPHTHLFHM